MGTVVSEGKGLPWKTSTMSKPLRWKAKQFACLEYLMVSFYIVSFFSSGISKNKC